MRVLSWNVRGLRNPERRSIISRYCLQWKPDVLFFQETLLEDVDSTKWEYFSRIQFVDFFFVPSMGRSRGQIISWRKDRFSMMDTFVGVHSASVVLRRRYYKMLFLFSTVYGPLNRSDLQQLWVDLSNARRMWDSIPWLVGGDFNVTLLASDRLVGKGGMDPGSEDFWTCINYSGLLEMGLADLRIWRLFFLQPIVILWSDHFHIIAPSCGRMG